VAPISVPFAEDEEVMESESPLAVSRPLSVSTTPTLKGLVSTFSAMTGDELERALSRHQERLSRQQYIVRQIAAEKERRRSDWHSARTPWQCPECGLQPRAFVNVPCRHLGLCLQCDALAADTGRCAVCGAGAEHKIAINFAE